MQEYNCGNKVEAEKSLTEITKESHIVINKLKELKQIIMDEKKQYTR